ncbi:MULTISPECIES: hypothetical protein [Nocardioides]|jgi:hypothetical protein|uniref:hypothetical protein n=1 Tax=Nocardioides TaxID=1839 RepID=UPI00032F3959|nr:MULTISPECIES: hypothetical protein [Nocardioides]EON22646.1 hypothetical protein CF8_3503 [Nocardioides sp. CF8]
MNETTPDEQAVLDELALALRSRDDIDPKHRVAAQAAFAWRTIDEELMELTYDSLLEPSTVRSAGVDEPRTVSFSSTIGSLELEIDGERIMGHVLPGGTVTVVMTNVVGQRVQSPSDEDGVFELMGSLPGPVRFTIEGQGTTQWLTF